MKLNELKEQLHSLIQESSNKALLEDLLLEVKHREQSVQPHEKEGLIKEEFDELVQLANEPVEKDTISYSDLKSSLSRWFIN